METGFSFFAKMANILDKNVLDKTITAQFSLFLRILENDEFSWKSVESVYNDFCYIEMLLKIEKM